MADEKVLETVRKLLDRETVSKQTDQGPVRAPALIHRNPECSLCCAETELEDDLFVCGYCGFEWSASDQDAFGVPVEPERPICGNRVRPFIDYRGPVALTQEDRERQYVCVLAAGHETRWCRGVNLDNPNWPDDHSWIDKRKGCDQ